MNPRGLTVSILLLMSSALAACDGGERTPLHGDAGGGPDSRAAAAASPAGSAEDEEIESLVTLGYVAGSDPGDAPSGVLSHDADRAATGFNFFTSAHAPVAVLMDMDGRVLHEWRADFRKLFPEHRHLRNRSEPRMNFWRDAHLLANGDIIGIWDLFGIFKLNRDSEIIWVVQENAHHDLHVGDDGGIHHLEAVRRPMPEIPGGLAVEDYIVERDENGAERYRLPMSEALRNADWPGLRRAFWKRATDRGYDLGERSRFDPFHTNSIWILSPRDAKRMGDPFRAGDALVSMATLDTIAVIDLVGRATRWWQQGPFGMQHGPRVTPDGKLILFNNFLAEKRSSVQVFDPQSREITSEFRGPKARPLYSLRSGGAEILANGNILIVETDRGRVLETTPEGEVVWEFLNPYRVGRKRDRVAGIYSLDRIEASKVAWLDR